MTPAEQDAFVEAFARCVSTVHPAKVASFVEDFVNDEDIDDNENYTVIMDALLMWHHAIKFTKQKELTA